MLSHPAKKHPLLNFEIPAVISDILLVKTLGRTPAMCFRKTGIMFISPEFLKLPIDYQKFIVAHEAGHIAHNTRDEFLADDYAVDWCIKHKMSLTNCLFAMTKVLSFPDDRPNQKAEQIARCERQFDRLMKHDAIVNKNPKAMKYINETVSAELDSFGGKFKKVVQKVSKSVNKPAVKAVVKAAVIPKPKNLVSAVKGVTNKPVFKPLAKPALKPLVKPFLKPLANPLLKPIIKHPALPLLPLTAKPVLTSIQTSLNNLISPPAPVIPIAASSPSTNAGGGYEDYQEPYYEDYEEEYDEEEYGYEDESEYMEDGEVDEIISDEMDSFGGMFKARKERKKTKVEAKAQKKRDEGEAKKMKAQASLELAKQGIVNKGLAGLGEGVGKLKMGDKYITEGDGKIMGMSKPMFFGVLAGVILLAGVAVWYFKFKK